MSIRKLLGRVPKSALLAAVLFAEVTGGFVMKVFLKQLDNWHEWLAFFLMSAAVLHWVHLIQDHYRARTPEDVSKTILKLQKDHPQTNWVKIEECFQTLKTFQGEFDSSVIEKWCSLSAHRMNLNGLLELIDLFHQREMSAAFVEDLIAELRPLRVPRQVEFIFKASLEDQVNKMNELADQRPVEGDLDTQYVYAGGVARYYRERGEVPTIYATALDIPSVFHDQYRHYFTIQEEFSIPDHRFEIYRAGEEKNLKEILYLGGKRAYHPYDPSEKARIVVISRETLLEDLGRDGFWKFLRWHVQHQFGVKFFIRDVKSAQKSYEEQLHDRMHSPKAHPIQDFIVYGSECVFGRINPQPKNGKNSLGFRYARAGSESEKLVDAYRAFFEHLWRDHDGERHTDDKTYTLTDLWEFKEFREKLCEQSKMRKEDLSHLYERS
jgi:hypothetical protein